MCTPGPLHPSSRGLGLGLLQACALSVLLVASPAGAQTPASPGAASTPATTEADDARLAAQLRALSRHVDTDVRTFASLEFGRGLRFNNPFRLATQLGATAQSVSLTASYADLGVAFAYGPPDGLQHGMAVHASFALIGVREWDLNFSYQLSYRGPRPFLTYGRIGPSASYGAGQPNVGAELAGGFAWFLTGRIAVASELVFDLYFGSGTHDVAIAAYPILSGQLGLLVEYEALK